MPRTRKFSELTEQVRSVPKRSRQIDELIAAYPREQAAYRLAELRRAFAVTQVELAALIGRSQSTVSQIENGDIAMSIDLLQSIVTQLGGTLEINAVFGDRRIELRV